MASVEIHLFDCGQGDTVLLRLPNGKHALIDCNLPDGPTRVQFFQLLEQWDVRHLDLLCLTHPHDDHYHGMLEVVEYFTSDGRSLGTFCDVGVDPKQVLDLMRAKNRPPPYIAEYYKLCSRLDTLFKQQKVRYFAGNRDSRPLIRSGDLYLMPIGPNPETARSQLRSCLRRSDALSRIREDLNLISLVMVLRMRGSLTCDALLAGDTDGLGLNHALIALKDYDGGVPCEFDFLKVAHHGSLQSHEESKICSTRRTTGDAVAAISTGTEYDVLPDREVIADFLNCGWKVVITTKRVGRTVHDRALRLASSQKTVADTYSTVRNTIIAKWTKAEGFCWAPAAAEITHAELGNYSSARDN